MKLSKICSINGINEILNFISKELKYKIINGNKFLNKRLDILFLKKRKFFKEKIKDYEFNYVKEYQTQFKNDFKIIIEENEIEDLFLYGLSKKDNFYLNLSDEYFTSLIFNPYFNENLNIELEDFPETQLIQNNKLTQKALKIFNDIFNSWKNV